MLVDIRDNLKELIKDKGLIQASIAKRINLSPSTLSMILNKTRRLDANELFDICRALEITPMDLYNYKSA
nr:MAG TPA: helix-turn-helix domain protein [Caudoviricetes sp.]